MTQEKPKSYVYSPQVITDNDGSFLEFSLAIAFQEKALKNQEVVVSILGNSTQIHIGSEGKSQIKVPCAQSNLDLDDLNAYIEKNMSIEVLQVVMGNNVKVQTLLVTNEKEKLSPEKKQNLPIGIQTFEKIIEGNFKYIDKTKQIYELIHSGSCFFLSRPRRFGKSLLVSTLDSIFRGKKELFEGLDIIDTDYEFKEHPIIRIDFSPKKVIEGKDVEQYVFNQTKFFAKKYNIDLEEEKFDERFKELIYKLHEKYKTKAVILIDEYDAPILNNLGSDKAKSIRDSLRVFYSAIKSSDEYLRFVFLTGITKFAKMNVFSGLNNLKDITDHEDYSSMLGYTQKELEENFAEFFPQVEEELELTHEQILEKTKLWYNGYKFSSKGEKMYNPFGTMLFLDFREFRNHWFETGTPTFLIDLIKKGNNNLEDFEGKFIDKQSYSSMNIDNLDIVPLLIQTGYLTINSYDKEQEVYTLGYPNYEVKHAFLNHVMSSYTGIPLSDTNNHIFSMKKNLEENDIATFFKTLEGIFSDVPNTIHLNHEKYYQTIFYTIFTMLGFKIDAEVSTNTGRIDVVIELEKRVYIIEFKLNGTANEAIEQIHNKKYYQKYELSGKEIYLIGSNFEDRNVGNYLCEKLK